MRMDIAFLYADPDGILDLIIEAKHQTGEAVTGSARARKRIRAEIAAAQDELRPLVRDARLTVFRALTIDAVALDALDPGDPIGTAWSYDLAGAHPFDGKAAHPLILTLTGIVSAHDVAWDHTIAVHSGGEAEIRLKRGAPVTLTGVTHRTARGSKGSTTLVRPDLVGQILTA